MKLFCDFYENPLKKVAVGLNGLTWVLGIWSGEGMGCGKGRSVYE
jgi:hypothetical protein